MFTAEEILDIAVRLEKNGEKIYRSAAQIVSKSELASLLEWMADEEVTHAENFLKMKKAVTMTAVDPVVEKMGRELVDSMLGERGFSLEDVDFARIDQVNDMIATFIEFEKDTLLFYEMLDSFLDAEETRKTLNRIMAEENNHIKTLQELLGTKTIAASIK